MGDMSNSVNYHYSKGNLEALRRIAEDTTVDEDDRDLAEEYIKKLEKKRDDREER